MNIKEIIDAEQWEDGWKITTEEANETLDRIKADVTAYVAEMEEALDVSYNAERESMKQHIAELEGLLHDSLQFIAYGYLNDIPGAVELETKVIKALNYKR